MEDEKDHQDLEMVEGIESPEIQEVVSEAEPRAVPNFLPKAVKKAPQHQQGEKSQVQHQQGEKSQVQHQQGGLSLDQHQHRDQQQVDRQVESPTWYKKRARELSARQEAARVQGLQGAKRPAYVPFKKNNNNNNSSSNSEHGGTTSSKRGQWKWVWIADEEPLPPSPRGGVFHGESRGRM